jgi:hypothetical protein
MSKLLEFQAEWDAIQQHRESLGWALFACYLLLFFSILICYVYHQQPEEKRMTSEMFEKECPELSDPEYLERLEEESNNGTLCLIYESDCDIYIIHELADEDDHFFVFTPVCRGRMRTFTMWKNCFCMFICTLGFMLFAFVVRYRELDDSSWS